MNTPLIAQNPPPRQPRQGYLDEEQFALLKKARNQIPFLLNEEAKVIEFWQIWSESIPPQSDLRPGQYIEYGLAVSADMQKVTWRTSGPQNFFIQRMVDFFWNVGAPESEIDRLNDIGALINPIKIGSWIDMSAKGGMDGGWHFPIDFQFRLAIEASDAGEPTKQLVEWADANDVTQCYLVGRDMGVAPPRQTEIRVLLPGADAKTQFSIAKDAFNTFGFPSLPDAVLEAVEASLQSLKAELCLSFITAFDGWVRLGVFIPEPPKELVRALVTEFDGDYETFLKLEEAVCTSNTNSGPKFVEVQYLMKGFGYGVYREGFDVALHYSLVDNTK